MLGDRLIHCVLTRHTVEQQEQTSMQCTCTADIGHLKSRVQVLLTGDRGIAS